MGLAPISGVSPAFGISPSPRQTISAWFSGSVRVRCQRPSLITYALTASAAFFTWLTVVLSRPAPAPYSPNSRVPRAVAADVIARQRAIPRGANVCAETGSLCERSISTSSSQRWKRSSTGRVAKAHWAIRLRLVMSVIGILFTAPRLHAGDEYPLVRVAIGAHGRRALAVQEVDGQVLQGGAGSKSRLCPRRHPALDRHAG